MSVVPKTEQSGRDMKMKRILATASTLHILAFWPTFAWAQPMADRDYWGNWGWGHMMFGGAMMFAFWGAIILLIVLAIRWMTMGDSDGRGEARSPSALDILQERFAKGEIDSNEYEERRKVLRE